MFFDARAAKALAPGKHIVIQGCPGLRLIASQTRKTWTYRYRSPHDGSLKQIKIGYWPDLQPVQAATRWQELRGLRDSGTDPVEARKVERATTRARPAKVAAEAYTLSQMVEDYATGYLSVHREPRGAGVIAQRLRKAMVVYGATRAADVNRAFVFQFIEERISTPVLAKSVKTEMAAAWRYAMEAGRVPENLPNWWSEKTSHKFRSKGAMRDGKRKGTGKRVLSLAELRILLTEDLALFSPQVSRFLEMQLWTCTRGAEICQMQRHQITQEATGWWWTIPKSEMKGRNVDDAFDLRVPLLGRARAIVETLLTGVPAEIPWLFWSRSRDGEIKGQTQAYMQSKVHYMQPYSRSRPDHVRRRLQVSHWSPHDLRRTGRTRLAAMGCPHEVGEAILGHVLPGVAGDYNLYQYDAERVLWLSRWATQLAELAAPDHSLPGDAAA
ncbi:tyrosine-type recombinase/integrase [Roseateles sp. UC29_93]|uniref:tyrosine-type recombinase/integrase n=1 Tax=Roseateles sp. UC29_93 TaxID=3350177 RepID=UPI00366CB48E